MCSGIWRSCHCLLVVLLLLVLCSITKSTDAKVFQVGGISGWTNWDVAQGRVPDYKTWAAAQSIVVGDSLEFSFAAGYHDVVLLHSSKEADREAYEMCDFAVSTVLDEGFTGTYVRHATYPGEFYFACELYSPSPKLNEYVPTHCATGQKLAITVKPNSTAEGPTSVGPPSVSTPPPSSPTPVGSSPVIVPIAAPTETPETPLSAPSGSPKAPISSAPSGSPGTPSSAPSGSPQAAAPKQVTPVTHVRSPAPPPHQEQNGAGTPASIPWRWIIAAAVMLMAKIAW